MANQTTEKAPQNKFEEKPQDFSGRIKGDISEQVHGVFGYVESELKDFSTQYEQILTDFVSEFGHLVRRTGDLLDTAADTLVEGMDVKKMNAKRPALFFLASVTVGIAISRIARNNGF